LVSLAKVINKNSTLTNITNFVNNAAVLAESADYSQPVFIPDTPSINETIELSSPLVLSMFFTQNEEEVQPVTNETKVNELQDVIFDSQRSNSFSFGLSPVISPTQILNNPLRTNSNSSINSNTSMQLESNIPIRTYSNSSTQDDTVPLRTNSNSSSSSSTTTTTTPTKDKKLNHMGYSIKTSSDRVQQHVFNHNNKPYPEFGECSTANRKLIITQTINYT